MREVRWASLEGDGVEHLTFDRSGGGIVVESAVVGQRYGRAYGLAYRVECDTHWRVTHAVLKVMGGGTLELRGERQPIDVAYISTPDLKVTPVKQAYACLEPGRRYRYEGIFRDFTAEMEIDDDGLVVDYETLFRRLPAPAPAVR
jgi:uncharacterized protein